MKTFEPILLVFTAVVNGGEKYLSIKDNPGVAINQSITMRTAMKDNFVLTDIATFDALNGNWFGSVIAVVDPENPNQDLDAVGYAYQHARSFSTTGEAHEWLKNEASRTGDTRYYVFGERSLTDHYRLHSKNYVVNRLNIREVPLVTVSDDPIDTECLLGWDQLWIIREPDGSETTYGRNATQKPLAEV
jgi:hypothetical protein